MKVLFLHQNSPGQYRHIAQHLAAAPANEIVFITQRQTTIIPGVKYCIYQPHRVPTPEQHHYLVDTEVAVLNAQGVIRIALELRESGFIPDIMVGHNGWGEIWYLKDVYPNVPLLGYFEFFYHLHGADTGFDPAYPSAINDGPRLRTKNMSNWFGLGAIDHGQCPTQWQKSLYPEPFQPRLTVIHEGIDTQIAKPNPYARIKIDNSELEISVGDEIVTYVVRNLEPLRGFESFMRSLPRVLEQRPQARVLIVGGDQVSYGARLPEGQTYRHRMLQELGNSLDLRRVHFLGNIPYTHFLQLLQISRVHVYLTYPFVLSWSMLEAMAAGCVVIGSETAPVEEVIRHGENGLLVDFFAIEKIATQIIEVLKEPQAFTQLKTAARQTIIEKYDLHTRCLPAYEQLLLSLTHNN